MNLFYYHFNIDQPESPADNVNASNFADEVDLIANWQATERLLISAVLAVAIPGFILHCMRYGLYSCLLKKQLSAV